MGLIFETTIDLINPPTTLNRMSRERYQMLEKSTTVSCNEIWATQLLGQINHVLIQLV